jgi:hypothetical protein
MYEMFVVKKLIRLCLLALLAISSGATSIVVVVTPQAVWIGADGKGIVGGTQFVETCKIHAAKDVVFAFTGFASSEYSKFSAYDIARGVVEEGGTLPEIVERFKQRILSPLTNATRVVYNTNRPGYDRDFRGKPLLEAVFVAGTPRARALYVRYTLEETPDGPLAELAQVIDMSDGNFLAIGRNEAIQKYRREHPADISQNDPLRLLRLFLNEEITHEPEAVGPPTSIVNIGAGGVRWVERGACR